MRACIAALPLVCMTFAGCSTMTTPTMSVESLPSKMITAVDIDPETGTAIPAAPAVADPTASDPTGADPTGGGGIQLDLDASEDERWLGFGTKKDEDVSLDPSILEGLETEEEAAQADGDKYGPVSGESLLSIAFSVAGSSTKSGGASSTTDTRVSLQVALGFFVTDEVEVGAQVLGSWSLPDTGTDSVFINIEPFANYNFRLSNRIWLYVGPHLGLFLVDSGGNTDTSFSVGAHGGARQWITSATALFAELRYTYTEYDLGIVEIEQNDITGLVGVSTSF